MLDDAAAGAANSVEQRMADTNSWSASAGGKKLMPLTRVHYWSNAIRNVIVGLGAQAIQ